MQKELFEEIKKDGYTYSTFKSLEDLQKAVRDRLVEHIKQRTACLQQRTIIVKPTRTLPSPTCSSGNG